MLQIQRSAQALALGARINQVSIANCLTIKQ